MLTVGGWWWTGIKLDWRGVTRCLPAQHSFRPSHWSTGSRAALWLAESVTTSARDSLKYVFGGSAPSVKTNERDEIMKRRERSKCFWVNLFSLNSQNYVYFWISRDDDANGAPISLRLFQIIIPRLFAAMKTSLSPKLCLINWSNKDILFLTIEHFMMETWLKWSGKWNQKKQMEKYPV